MGLMLEVKKLLSPETIDILTIRCKVFEGNEGAKAMATVPKMRPRTKHINGRMHHLASRSRCIRVKSKSNQLANIGTKPLAKDLFT